jgi:hypothetical protein
MESALHHHSQLEFCSLQSSVRLGRFQTQVHYLTKGRHGRIYTVTIIMNWKIPIILIITLTHPETITASVMLYTFQAPNY